MTGTFREIDTLDGKIEKVSDEDMHSISGFIASLFEEIAEGAGYTREQVKAFKSEMTPEKMKVYLNGTYTVLYEDDGQFIALGLLSPNLEDHDGVVHLYKGRDHEGKGREILQKLEKKATQLKLKKVYIHIADSQAVKNIFSGLGYRESDPIDYTFGSTEIHFAVMEKGLAKEQVMGQSDLS